MQCKKCKNPMPELDVICPKCGFNQTQEYTGPEREYVVRNTLPPRAGSSSVAFPESGKAVLQRNGQRFGPYSLDDINKMIAEGTVLISDQAQLDDGKWVVLRKLDGIVIPPPTPLGRPSIPANTPPVQAAPPAGQIPAPPPAHSPSGQVVFLEETNSGTQSAQKLIAIFAACFLAFAVMGVLVIRPIIMHQTAVAGTDKTPAIAIPQKTPVAKTATMMPSEILGYFYDELMKTESETKANECFELMSNLQTQMQGKANHFKDVGQYDKASPYELTATCLGSLKEWKTYELLYFQNGSYSDRDRSREALQEADDLAARADKGGAIVVNFDFVRD